jgi:phosphoglycerate kinase
VLKVQSNLPNAQLKNKRVLLRADLNIPRARDGEIINDFRLKELLPTIELIKKKGGKIILLSHCGRPSKSSPQLSTKIFEKWFIANDHEAVFAKNLKNALTLSKKDNNSLVILENLRFFPGEKNRDKSFAKDLSGLGDYYVNDAFALTHRNDTSITLLPELFDKKNRTTGLLIEKEITILNQLIENIKHPFIVIQGGIKGETKLSILSSLLKKVDAILLSTPLCFSFLKALKKPVGKSFAEESLIPEIKKFLAEAEKRGIPIILPVDYQVTTDSFDKPHALTETKTLSDKQIGVSIGPETVQLFSSYLRKARTVFMNGMPGNIEYPETMEGLRILLNTLQQTNATCVIAGGDTVALVEQLGFKRIGHFSTGGGASLAYLSGQALPGLTLFT